MRRRPHSAPLAWIQSRLPGAAGRACPEVPAPAAWGSWEEPVCPASPTHWGPCGAQTPPELHACPCCLSVSALRCPGPQGALRHAALSTPPAPLLPGNMPILLLHSALAAPCGDGVRATEADGPAGAWTPPSVSACLGAPGHLPPGRTRPQRPPPCLLHSLPD